MKNMMNRILAATALLACFACAKTETDLDKATSLNGKGKVYGYIEPLTQDTRAYWENTDRLPFHIEVGDYVNVWTPKGTHMEYKVSRNLAAGHFELDTDEFSLKPGLTYSAGFPFVSTNATISPTAQIITYEGQKQTDQSGDQLTDLAKYLHLWSVSTCDESGNTSFKFRSIGTVIRVIITLPEEGMTISEVKLTADKPVFALNGTADFTTGAFTATGALSESLTMTLDDVTVSGNVLKAFFGSAPLAAANYVISVTDNAGNVYKSEEIVKEARPAHSLTEFIVNVAPEGGYVKLTSMPSDPAGQYILVYPEGTTYHAFSFTKTMANAAAAAASVSSVSGLENLYNQSSTLYNMVVNQNYVDITGEANATILTPTPEQEAAAAITIAANTNPWTVTAPAVDLQTTFTSGSNSMRVDHLVANVASDGKADLVAAFNATDAVAAMNALRGHNVNVTFNDLIDLAMAKVDGFTPDDFMGSNRLMLTMAFNKLVAFASDIVEENPRNLFPANSHLMPINLSTNAFDVFKQYHDNAAEISWRMSPEKKFGLAQLGFNLNANGFTASVNLPSYEWITRLGNAIAASADKTSFVQYWASFDSNSAYDVKIDGQKIDGFYTKLAGKFAATLSDGEYGMLRMKASKFPQLANSYKTLAEKLNTGIQPAYIYKKVQ